MRTFTCGRCGQLLLFENSLCHPFTLAETVIEKLAYVHERVLAVGSDDDPNGPPGQEATPRSQAEWSQSSRSSRGGPSPSTVTEPPGQ